MNHIPDVWKRRTSRFILMIMVMLIWTLARSAHATPELTIPWPMLHFNNQRIGRTTVTGPGTNNVKWTFRVNSGINASPVVGSDGTIYFGAWNNKLYAVTKTGFLKWTFNSGNWISSSAAVGSDGAVYFGSWDKKIYAVNANGSLRWQFTTGDIVTSSPVMAADGTVYAGSWDFKLYAINPNGTQKWQFPTGGYVSASPALAPDGTIYVGSWDGKLYAINPNTGIEVWHYTAATAIAGSPAVGSDGTVYFGQYGNVAGEGILYALNSNGTLKWSYATAGYIRSSPALAADGTVYIGASWDGNRKESLYAVQPPTSGSTGLFHWQTDTGNSNDQGGGDEIISLPAVGGDGRVYIGGKDGRIRALQPGDGSTVWSYLTGGSVDSSPAIGGDGTLYVGSWDGELYAFGTALNACSNRDFTGDGRISVADIIYLASKIGLTSTSSNWDARFDLVPDNEVKTNDISALISFWRTVC
ncbi:MAG: PQQ-binding-like beta-propeller repeat protein [Chloroflexi bacterium]|nr:PQQ-binding-like beta-propeller repeat protein [Chloroflexota bacterium]